VRRPHQTDQVDARVLAERCRSKLVAALWIPSLEERAMRERLKRRLHFVRLRTSAKNRIFGLLSQWGLRFRAIACADPTRWSCWRHAVCPGSGAAPWPRRSR
jgi:transposase